MADGTKTIVAVTGEGETFDAVRSRASAMASGGGATVILYDMDAANAFESPLPNQWAGEGEEQLVSDRLGPDDLEALGRAPLARQVRDMRQVGIDAWAWLPEKPGADELARYASDQGADLILVPRDLEKPGLLDRVQGKDADQIRDKADVPIETVG
jgi:hypothetical protein